MIKRLVHNVVSYFVGMFFISMIFSVIGFFADLFSGNDNQKKPIDKQEKNVISSASFFKKYNSWYDNLSTNKGYDGTFTVRQSDYYQSKYYRNNDGSNVNTYTAFYSNLIGNDIEKLDLVFDELERIALKNNLTRHQFANVIVSFVQDIPYSLLIPQDCQSSYYSSEIVKDLIDQGFKCHGNEVGGLYSPVEFIKNFHGDCDTRTLFLWSVLSYFNYDVVILNSEFYGHSILGLNQAASGKYKTIYGKRYYAWETTAKGYKLGMIPADCSNMYYWEVAMPSIKNN